jgi:cytoskeletal protein RodZ
MTDHDRGAYTPPTDEALAFDARRQSDRRPVPMTLVGSAVVLVVLIVGVAVVYRGGVRGVDEAPRPIGQSVVAVKTPPPAAAPANRVRAVDDGESKSAAAPAPPETSPATTATPPKAKPAAKLAVSTASPTFAPAPEQPAARPQPAAKTLALLDQPGQAVGPARVRVTPPPGRPIRSAGGLDAGEVAAAGMTGAASSHAAPAHAASTPFKVATAGPKSIDAALASANQTFGQAASGPVVQIGAFSSAALSDQGYADVSKIMVGQMAGKAKHVMTVDHDGATLFRTWVSGFATRAQAGAFCAALKAHSKPCFVKG